MSPIEQAPHIEKTKDTEDLNNFTGLEKTNEGIDISDKMKWLLWKTIEHEDQVSDKNDDTIIHVAEWKLWIIIWNDEKLKADILKELQSKLD